MRALQSLVGIQALVLVVLLAVWWQRAEAGAPPPPASPTIGNTHANATAAAGGPADTGAESARIVRELAPAPGDAGAPVGNVVLQGRFTGVSPLPDADAIRLSLGQGRTWRGAELSPSGAYSVTGLAAGTWRVRCDATGCRLLDFEHTLDHAPIQRLDIELQPAYALPVFVRTSDDKRLATELAKIGIWQGMHVVATKEPLLGDLPPTESSSVGNIGVGRLRRDNDLNQRMDPDGGDGVLELDEPPPVHAAVLLRHMLLAQQRVEPGQRELRFTVDLDAVQQRLAKVRLRVLAGGQVVAKARIELETAQGGGSQQVTDEHGVAAIENVLPGLASFSIWAKDLEQYVSHVTIPAGADVDLGDVVLTPPTEVLGRVTGADGNPVAATLQWTAIDLWRPPHPLIDRRSGSADGDGNFQLWGAGLRRYTVMARTEDGRVGFAIVDAAEARTERFGVTVRPTSAVHLSLRDALDLRAAVVSDAAGNPLVVRRIEPRWPKGSIELPDGDYQLIVYDGHGRQLLREPLRVAGRDIEKELP